MEGWNQPNVYQRIPTQLELAEQRRQAEAARWRTWANVLPWLAAGIAIVSPAILVMVPLAVTVLAFVALSKAEYQGWAFTWRLAPLLVACLCILWALSVVS